MTDDLRLIEDYLPIAAISKEASREKSVRKGHISTLHLWWARRPLVACRAAVYGALVPADQLRPKNGPEENRASLGRANAAKFVERLCKYATQGTPKKSEAVADATRHGGDKTLARAAYEQMMGHAFCEANRVLKTGGQMVVVYAHKTTLGWATLVDALRRSGFTVTEAWPLDTERPGGIKVEKAMLASSIFLIARKRDASAGSGSYEEDVQPELETIVRGHVDVLWQMGITGSDLVIAAVGKVSAVDPTSRFYVLWRNVYKAAEVPAGEAIVFQYGQDVELDGPAGLSSGKDALLDKKKGKYRLRDYTERGNSEDLGYPWDDGTPAPLIDVLHRTLWLMENSRPQAIREFLDEARPNREQLRVIAAALAGPGLSGKSDEDRGRLLATTPDEQSALGKLLANWKSLVPESLFDSGRK